MNDDTMVFQIVHNAIKQALAGRDAKEAAAHAADQIDALAADLIARVLDDQPTNGH